MEVEQARQAARMQHRAEIRARSISEARAVKAASEDHRYKQLLSVVRALQLNRKAAKATGM